MADGMAGGRDSYHPALFNWFSIYFNWVLILFGLATHLSVLGCGSLLFPKTANHLASGKLFVVWNPVMTDLDSKQVVTHAVKKQKYHGFHRRLRLLNLISKDGLWELGLRYLFLSFNPPPTFRPMSWKRNFLKQCQIFHIKH